MKTKWNVGEYINGRAKYWLEQGNKQKILREKYD